MRIAVSACLLGEPCRYDGKSVVCPQVIALAESHELVAICPECMGGLPTPRPRAEIICGAQSASKDKHVVNIMDKDVTYAYQQGAAEALRVFHEQHCSCAILKSRSPSCGVYEVHDGTFGEGMVVGNGVTAALFAEQGIRVYDETDIKDGWHGAE